MHKKKWIAAIIIIIASFILIYLAFTPFINHIGKNEIHAIAVEKNYCRSDDCAEGVAYVRNILQQQSGIDENLLEWCMATNRIYYTDFAFLNALKIKFADWMYQRCERNELTIDDANIEIGDQHNHEHEENE